MLSRLLALGLALAAVLPAGASGTGPVEAPPVPGSWSKVGTLAEGPTTHDHVTGWDTGVVWARPYPLDHPVVFTSPDGVEWRPSTPPGLTEVWGVAGYGDAGYVLGSTAHDVVVWRTTDGVAWQPFGLGTGSTDGVRPSFGLAAGPRGVLVVAVNADTPGLFQWHSRDGTTWGTARVVDQARWAEGPVVVAATPVGFLVGVGRVLLASPDGARWTDLGFGEGRIRLVAGSRSTAVVFTRPDEGEAVTTAWYLRDGRWRPARVDPGTLPEPGVVPARRRAVHTVLNWRDGFLAGGTAYDPVRSVGVAWTSADGSSWQRIPTRAGGVAGARSIDALATSGDRALAFGREAERDAVWAGVGPSRRPPATSAPVPVPEPGQPQVYDPWRTVEAVPRATGECASESYAIGRPDAYRCFVVDTIHDICLAHPSKPVVACVHAGEVVVVGLDAPLPERTAVVGEVRPWRVELASGDVCTAVRGPRPELGGHDLQMVCGPGSARKYLWALQDDGTALTSTEPTGPLERTEVRAVYR
ncbi:hypothetical protein DFJ66_6329 [Saccharothrix variisporea]|uniref:Uncharacterized protein n=1 Tax=Saccharothrix variisporea TaxID=543527 RepID=A0A495XKQ6_9PSEU|nr:hypothetical protein DFJ66_6329 [Saccharothrix variisporea]